MTQEQEKSVFDFEHWSDGGDIFYRPQDKIQFHRSLKAVINEHLGLAVVADGEKILNHYCRLMVSRLRATQEFKLEVLLPSNTDNLLKRFNQIMASMSIDQALRPPTPDSQVTLMVVNDAHLVEQEQWLLLSQLLSDFPGVNIRLILFIDVTEWPRYEKPLRLFGRKLHQWKLEIPSSLEAKNLLIAAQQNGFRSQVDGLLSDLAIDIPEGIFDEKEGADNVFIPVTPLTKSINPMPIEARENDDVDNSKEAANLTKKTQPSIQAWAVLILIFVGVSLGNYFYY